MSYIKIIEQAIIFFPFFAVLITVPFVLIQYHKYGSISFLKSLIIYSFILYLLCAYFLVILPLPSIESVVELTTPRTQLIPFMFVYEFMKSTALGIKMFKMNTFYMPLFNVLLTIPFGIYIRYLFKTDLKKSILYSFLLSLFFELTQLSGLYFIYSRGYRLFDVDDLFLNTLGGTLGYLIGQLMLKPLPTIDKVNNMAIKKGSKVSGLKRSVSFLLDLSIYSLVTVLITFLFNNKHVAELIILFYYIIIPVINNGATLGQKFLNLRIIAYNNKHLILKLVLRIVLFLIIYLAIPIGAFCLISFIGHTELTYLTKCLLDLIIAIVIFLMYFITFVKFLFTGYEMAYEKISRTKLISTVNMNEK